jgi:hypothetical protein
MKTLFMRRNFTPDPVLLDQLLSNNTTAFEELYHRYWYPLYSYALSKLDSTDDAKLIVRNIFVQLWQQRLTLSANFSLPSYLYAEVRRATVACLNNKLNTPNEGIVTNKILPGFSVQQLQKARQPVKTIIETASGHHPDMPNLLNYKSPAERWLEKMNGLAVLKLLRHSFLSILHI